MKRKCRSGLLSVASGMLALVCGCGHLSQPHTGAMDAPAAKTQTGGSIFENVASQAGLRYQWTPSGKRPLNILQTIGNGCAFLDYDNDGNLDILLVGPHPALFRGDGKGHFEDVTQAMGLDKLNGHFLGCAVGDYDNDGYADIYLSAYRGGVLLHNEGGKGYKDVTQAAGLTAQPWGTSCAFGDIDGDGRLDLYICNYAVFGPDTLPQLCNFHGTLSSCGPHYYMPEKGVLYHNEGGGKFRNITPAWGAQSVHGRALGAAFADYDDSGKQSLALANDESPGDLLQNRGRKFTNVGVESGTAYDSATNVHGGMGLDWGDFNNDGKLDLAVATFYGEDKCVYRNEGGGVFTEMCRALGMSQPLMPYVAFGVKFIDYDNDGFLDLMFANGHVQDNIDALEKTTYREPLALLHNRGGTSFEDVSPAIGETSRIVGRGLAVGDFDNDGKMDVLVVDSEGAPLLLHNKNAANGQGSGGHWLGVTLVGVRSNRDGYGAILTATSGAQHWTQRCGTDGSYLSASDKRVHFGLGQSATLDTLTVQWPSGHKDVIRGLVADRYITLREGDSNPVLTSAR